MNTHVKVCGAFLCALLWLPVTVYSEPGVDPLSLQGQVSPAILVGQEFTGEAFDVASGETFTMRTPESRQIEVWLAEIEAPEKGQIYWDASRRSLAEKVLGMEVTIQVVSIRDMEDGYDYVIAQVYVGNRWINMEMVAAGWAWYYPQYLTSQELANAEKQAREKKLGVWAFESPKMLLDYRNTTQALPEENQIQPLLKLRW
jgi:endonuclease YncB( thermonuclease family)